MKNKYRARNGADFTNEVANIVGHFFEDKLDEGYALTPENIIEWAKPVNSPLHELLDWDDNVASHKWRVNQARMIVQKVMKVYLFKGKTIEQRAFLSVRKESRKVYVKLETVLSHKEYKNQHIDKILTTMANAQEFLKMLKEI